MTYKLLHHQEEGAEFLTGQSGGLLAFEQGLGKTLVAIDAFSTLLFRNKVEQMLVVCPNSLKRNWKAEIEKFAPQLTVAIAEGSPKRRRAIFHQPDARVIVTSYETSRSEVTAILALLQRRRSVLVLDESHATKNQSSQTSIAAQEFAPYALYRWLLSGTPVTNTATDLHTQIGIIRPGRNPLGTVESFSATLDSRPDDPRIRSVVDELILRRTKEQCLDLPDKSFVDVRIELEPWQRTLYDDMRHQMVCEIEAMTGEQYTAFASTALSQLTRLVQIATNPQLLFPELERDPAKFLALDNILAEIMSVQGRKVILWSNYIRSIEVMLERFQRFGAAAIYGGTPNDVRQDIAREFQEGEELRVLIANPAAAGTGFTLTAASHTVYESLSWRYDHYAQSQDRNHRIGQTQPVTYTRLLAADTIEDAIITALERKSILAGSLLGDGAVGEVVSQLSRDQMCELLRTNRLPEVDQVSDLDETVE
ncbi:MAG: DEAD/DEAH box helicase [Henriciella sp.]